jgi:hypothetical protein
MAQGTKSSGKRSGSSRSSSRSGSSSTKASSRSRRRSSNGSRATRSASRSQVSGKRTSGGAPASRAKSTARGGASGSRAAPNKAGGRVVQVASKAKIPLVAGGAALAGIAGALVMRDRSTTRNPLKKMSAPSMPKGMSKSLNKLDPSNVDIDSLTSAGRRVGKIGQQVGAVAEAADWARKKSK